MCDRLGFKINDDAICHGRGWFCSALVTVCTSAVLIDVQRASPHYGPTVVWLHKASGTPIGTDLLVEITLPHRVGMLFPIAWMHGGIPRGLPPGTVPWDGRSADWRMKSGKFSLVDWRRKPITASPLSKGLVSEDGVLRKQGEAAGDQCTLLQCNLQCDGSRDPNYAGSTYGSAFPPMCVCHLRHARGLLHAIAAKHAEFSGGRKSLNRQYYAGYLAPCLYIVASPPLGSYQPPVEA
jgi:hypothetical protein